MSTRYSLVSFRCMAWSFGLSTVAWLLIGLCVWSVAHADMSPEMPELLSVQCGHPNYAYTYGEQSVEGTYAGKVYESNSCSTGGRGAKVRRYSACATAQWDANGSLIEWAIVSSTVGSTVPGSAACLGAP